jgi:hypothetical protein
MEILVNRTGLNYALIKSLDNKVHSMINLVERIPIDTTKEENNLKMALEALLRNMNERKVEEVKMLSEVKNPLLDLEKCSLHELMSILQKFASDPLIRRKRIYNFLCSMLDFHQLIYVLFTLRGIFLHFLELTY